ncbi:NucA/NucB deoxyribonuclease domain-containing protein [Kitasatospora sp. NPDC093679]|uniref:NucA/NucB deoxyribonuclease domain-containing protein n=1 Tax=Kitasatospora sp. NPDC093679 TaxID=3154983 RepID=UPI0034279EBB
MFVEARVELVMKPSDPLVARSARHIKDARSNPERTFPSFVGTTVPGEKEPLHRLIDRAKQDTNRTAAIKTCDDVWGNYAGSGLECDEYPFSSTYEGAAAGGASPTGRYSSRLIDAADNGAGGNMILAVYTQNRVLDGDPFYVKTTP